MEAPARPSLTPTSKTKKICEQKKLFDLLFPLLDLSSIGFASNPKTSKEISHFFVLSPFACSSLGTAWFCSEPMENQVERGRNPSNDGFS